LSHYTRSFLCWVFLRLSLENYLLGAGTMASGDGSQDSGCGLGKGSPIFPLSFLSLGTGLCCGAARRQLQAASGPAHWLLPFLHWPRVPGLQGRSY
jgi:hypothetical protein